MEHYHVVPFSIRHSYLITIDASILFLCMDILQFIKSFHELNKQIRSLSRIAFTVIKLPCCC